MASLTEVQYLCTFNIIVPLIYHFCHKYGMLSYTISASMFVHIPYWPSYRTDKLISCAVPGPSQWFFHFGEDIVIACTQEKTTALGGTEPHHSSWQSKESERCCCCGLLAPLAMGDSGTSTVLTRYGVHVITISPPKWKNHCEEPGTTHEMNLSVL